MPNTQTTLNTASTTFLNKDYREKKTLAWARTKMIHAKFGQKRPIPEHNGKRVEFRRWDTFDPNEAMTPLTEGVTPTGLALSQTNVEAEVAQYGAYVEISDMLKKTNYANDLKEVPALLGELMGTVLEWITRDAMNAGTNVQFANGKTERVALTANDKLTVDEIRKAVRTLKKAKARKFNGSETGGKPGSRKPHFICICSPDAVYDLQSDPLWQDVSKYSNAEQIYDGEIGRLFGVVFVESTEAKVFEPAVINSVNADTSSSTSFVLKNTPTAAEVAYLSKGGNELYIDGTKYTLASSGSYAEASKTVTLSAAASLTADSVVCSADAGAVDATTKKPVSVHSTLVFGADAYGTIDIGGSGAVQSILKGLGSAGAADPLEQRATMGAKIMAYTATILNELWIVRIEHGVTA